MKKITIPLKTYECLRGHLQEANDIFNSLGMVGGLANKSQTPKPNEKESKTQKINKYKKLIMGGTRKKHNT